MIIVLVVGEEVVLMQEHCSWVSLSLVTRVLMVINIKDLSKVSSLRPVSQSWGSNPLGGFFVALLRASDMTSARGLQASLLTELKWEWSLLPLHRL